VIKALKLPGEIGRLLIKATQVPFGGRFKLGAGLGERLVAALRPIVSVGFSPAPLSTYTTQTPTTACTHRYRTEHAAQRHGQAGQPNGHHDGDEDR
jgi:hypothetical protein